ncbi:hypothetical protein PG_1811 [Porphyromonas gingivalis W83]|uniref:Uncharacterized protein n=1 Tax=Porphyromonas gingivalis (strain ATCC BAA-308 / W83) TaxID=242619 RepID=Q7MTX0_PORGI|nr:hypothetical protein PG_1811 [Porphyromonas gingivalis W83]
MNELMKYPATLTATATTPGIKYSHLCSVCL